MGVTESDFATGLESFALVCFALACLYLDVTARPAPNTDCRSSDGFLIDT